MLRWIRARRWVPEALIASALLLIGLFDAVLQTPLALVPTLSLALAVFVFRAVPWLTSALVLVGAVLAIWLEILPMASLLAALSAVFLHSALGSLAIRVSTAITAGLSALGVLWFAVFESHSVFATSLENFRVLTFVLSVSVVLLLIAIAFILGRYLVVTGRDPGDDSERAVALQRQAGLGLEVARQTERLSIARDLSELLVQRVSAVVSLSEGGSFALKTQPDSAPRVMGKVLDSARAAQTELRRLYDMLHEEHSLAAAPPKLADLEEVILSMRALGYNAKTSVDGTPYEIDEGAELCIFKIVWESLENVKKHAPLGTDVSVDFFWTQDGLQVLVKDNGIETSRRLRAPKLADISSGYTQEDDFNALVEKVEGATLSVLNERAAIYEGSIESTRVPGVGFTLSALFPNLKAVAGK